MGDGQDLDGRPLERAPPIAGRPARSPPSRRRRPGDAGVAARASMSACPNSWRSKAGRSVVDPDPSESRGSRRAAGDPLPGAARRGHDPRPDDRRGARPGHGRGPRPAGRRRDDRAGDDARPGRVGAGRGVVPAAGARQPGLAAPHPRPYAAGVRPAGGGRGGLHQRDGGGRLGPGRLQQSRPGVLRAQPARPGDPRLHRGQPAAPR